MDEAFYEGGLFFECTRCSRCCRHEPGYVFLSFNDIERLAAATRLTFDEFIDTYCRIINYTGFKRISLSEKENFDCILWDKGGCT
ncbi:MAG: YkgJ family cysteine cluster protein, partial [Spirochaetota bacterium]